MPRRGRGVECAPLKQEEDNMAKILVVDDEAVLVKGIRFNLQQAVSYTHLRAHETA